MEVSGTSVWVIVGILVGIGIVSLFVVTVIAWLLKAIIERFIASVDANANATSALTAEMQSHKVSIQAELQAVRTKQEADAHINDMQFKAVHDRLDRGAEFHQELKDWKPKMEREVGDIKVALARRGLSRTTTSKVHHAGKDESKGRDGG